MNWTIEFYKEDFENFNGKKTIEVRALDADNSKKAYYSKIKEGDSVIFTYENLFCKKLVKDVRKYRTIDKLLSNEDFIKISPSNDANVFEEYLTSFPGYKDRIKKYGLIAVEPINE